VLERADVGVKHPVRGETCGFAPLMSISRASISIRSLLLPPDRLLVLSLVCSGSALSVST
jgi:hypothetical protein